VVEEARRLGSRSLVLTFEPHPLKVVTPSRAPKLILTDEDKMQLFQSLGVDIAVVLPFDLELAQMETKEFVRRYLVDLLRIRKIWVGADLRFIHGRGGGVSDLMRWAVDLGFEVGVVEPILDQGVRPSSSQVRRLLDQGRVRDVEPILGRYHFLSGKMVSSHRSQGRSEFLNVNIVPRTEALPADGVYTTLFALGTDRWPSVSNIGLNPAFPGGTRTVESLIFQFHRQLHTEPVKISFLQRIPDQIQFKPIEEFFARLQKDANLASICFSLTMFNSSASAVNR
jgi:riboflavin kinase/FMN adenylyltransferase